MHNDGNSLSESGYLVSDIQSVCVCVPKATAFTTSVIGVVSAVSYASVQEPQVHFNIKILLGPVPGLKALVNSSLLMAQH